MEYLVVVVVVVVSDPGDREQLMSLLSELKVMSHLGSNLNILNILGAVTTDLDKGNLLTLFTTLYHCYALYIYL